MGYTDEELAALSETERAALTATDEDDDDTLNDIIGNDDSDDDDDSDSDDSSDDDKDDDKGDDDGKDDSDAGDDKGSDDTASSGEDTDVDLGEFDLDSVPAVNFVPVLTGEILPEYEEKITALDVKLDEGELSAAEHRKEVRKLEAQSQNETIAAQRWEAEQAAFAKSLGFKTIADYAKNGKDFEEVNKEVIRIANDPSQSHLNGIQILSLARHTVLERADYAAYKAAKKAGTLGKDPVDGKKSIPPKPAAKKPDIKTLRDTPAADEAEVGQDKYAYLDKLSGMALEKAVAKLSPAEYDAYVKGA